MQAAELPERASSMSKSDPYQPTSGAHPTSREDVSNEEDELSDEDQALVSRRKLDVESIMGRQNSKRRRLSTKQVPRSTFVNGKHEFQDDAGTPARLPENGTSHGSPRRVSSLGESRLADVGHNTSDTRAPRDSYRAPSEIMEGRPLATRAVSDIERRSILQKSPPEGPRRSLNTYAGDLNSSSPFERKDRNEKHDGRLGLNSAHSSPRDGEHSPMHPAPRVQSQPTHMPPPNPRAALQTSPPLRRPLSPMATSGSRVESEPAPPTHDEDLNAEEVDIFLDLIIKHNPETMTPENMTRSVNALYDDWLTLCATRSIVAKPKKALMDEYGKIYNGKYGPVAQHRARLIAQEGTKPLQHPRRPSNTRRGSALTNDLAASESGELASQSGSPPGAQPAGLPLRADANRRSGQGSDRDSDTAAPASVDRRGSATLSLGRPQDDPASKKRPMTGDELMAAVASRKRAEGTPSDDPGSNIAQVGRNGLAVLPPGLFDILSNHLKDEILGGIMPLVRTDLTDQTRDLALQNQDLISRLRSLEEQVRNQDLWLRQLLFRDQADWTSQAHPVKKEGRMEAQQAAFPHEVELARDGVGYRESASGPPPLISPAPRQRWRGMSPESGAMPAAPPVRSSGPHISSRTPPPHGVKGRHYYRNYPQSQALPPPDYSNGGIRSAPPMREWRASLGYGADFAPPPPPQLRNKPPSPPTNRRAAPPYSRP